MEDGREVVIHEHSFYVNDFHHQKAMAVDSCFEHVLYDDDAMRVRVLWWRSFSLCVFLTAMMNSEQSDAGRSVWMDRWLESVSTT